jgi:hypothetical protein
LLLRKMKSHTDFSAAWWIGYRDHNTGIIAKRESFSSSF